MNDRRVRAVRGEGVAAAFPETRWSRIVVLQESIKSAENPDCQRIMEELCQAYWVPIYGYLRRHGFGPEDAEDITQDFLSGMVHRGVFCRADKARGRLRSYLLTSLKHFVAERGRAAGRIKRGSGIPVLSLDIPGAERELADFLSSDSVSDKIYDRLWAEAILNRVRSTLSREYAEKGQLAVYGELMRGMGLEQGAAKGENAGSVPVSQRVALYRFRQRFKGLVEAELRETVTSAEDLREELRYLSEVITM